MLTFTHLIITRFNVRTAGWQKPPNLEWLEHRFQLFDQFCYPSVRAQTSQQFKWIVFFDAHTPDSCRKKIAEYARWEQFVPQYIESWDTLDFHQVVLPYLTEKYTHLITTRIDNDDAFNRNYVESIQREYEHQDLLFLNFSHGRILDVQNDKLYQTHHYSNPFVSLVERIRPGQAVRTVWCANHKKIQSIARVKQIHTREPQWLVVVHANNALNRVGKKKRVSIKGIDNLFGVKYEKDSENLLSLYVDNAQRATMTLCRKILASVRRFQLNNMM